MISSMSVAQEQRPVMRAPNAENSFATWQGQFRTQALAAGISSQVFDLAFQSVHYTPKTRASDANQAEFIRPIWEYLDGAVSARNIAKGRQKAADYGVVLKSITQKYGVASNVLLAIWSMETNYGGFRGTTYTIEALANIAHAGRRQNFAQSELIAGLKILASGAISQSQMIGGWSGAMGHTQFMPTTYLAYAVDHNGDGRRDIWADDPSDALASTAHYLNRLGWDNSIPWGLEVTLPRGFDYALIGEHQTQSARFWNIRGLRTMSGEKLPDHGPTALLAPTGARGPVFAIFSNFQVIRQYNMSISYALAVGHLSDRIAGLGPLQAPWPRNDPQLSRAEIREIQQRLIAMGLDTGGADGMIGPKSVEAIQVFQTSNHMLADGYPTQELLESLR